MRSSSTRMTQQVAMFPSYPAGWFWHEMITSGRKKLPTPALKMVNSGNVMGSDLQFPIFHEGMGHLEKLEEEWINFLDLSLISSTERISSINLITTDIISMDTIPWMPAHTNLWGFFFPQWAPHLCRMLFIYSIIYVNLCLT